MLSRGAAASWKAPMSLCSREMPAKDQVPAPSFSNGLEPHRVWATANNDWVPGLEAGRY